MNILLDNNVLFFITKCYFMPPEDLEHHNAFSFLLYLMVSLGS